MQVTRTLPESYMPTGTLTLKGNGWLIVALNLFAIPWGILCALFFLSMASLLRPATDGLSGTTSLLPVLLLALVSMVAVIVLHELIHGLFFWLVTRSRPRFGFRGAYAYAAAPDWYIPKTQFLLVGLAPLVLISLVGLFVLPLTNAETALFLVVALIANATGAIGDLYMAARLLFAPRDALIQDVGETVNWFAPATPNQNSDPMDP